MKYAHIAIAGTTPTAFTYLIPDELRGKMHAGMRVCVPFRRRRTVGYVLGTSAAAPKELAGKEVRPIESVLGDAPVFSPAMIEWLMWIARYYCAPIGEVCRAAVPSRLNQLAAPKPTRALTPREMEYAKIPCAITLTHDQRSILTALTAALGESKPSPFLLHGITGSGKTEVYLHLFEEVRRAGGQAIMLVPEIGLTPQLSARVVERFGGRVALYHSGLTDAQRHHQWERMRTGEVDVVVGTRSALFAPLPKLRAIVIDEEHDASYKQDEGVLYHARDAAVMRAKIEGAVIVLGSATPSVESFANARQEKYRYAHLKERTGGGALPAIEVVDMRTRSGALLGEGGRTKPHERSALSSEMIEAIRDTLARGEQGLIFLNRRGFAHFIICEECGHSFECPNCNIALAYHQRPPQMLCHYCDYTIRPPEECPGCHGVTLKPMGRGTERIEIELGTLFPKARIARLDRDTLSATACRTEVFTRMRDGDIDILVGTQLIAKGHDFPGITLVGVVSADVALHLPDFRAAERTFQLITQVAGRAGRSGKGGRVILQTYRPDHASLIHASTHDYLAFYEEERQHREEMRYPPFSRLANVRIAGMDDHKVEAQADEIAKLLSAHRRTLGLTDKIALLGPAPAPLQKIRNRHRWQLLIKARGAKELATFLGAVYPRLIGLRTNRLRIAIDVDPLNMM